jgi:hypothetical protein
MSEADYTVVTYDTPVAFATTLARANPGMVLVHVSGAHTDGTEQGRIMWARVKGSRRECADAPAVPRRVQLPAGSHDAEAGTEAP